MLDEAGRQFSCGPTAAEVQEALHAVGPPPSVLAEGVLAVVEQGPNVQPTVDVWISAGPRSSVNWLGQALPAGEEISCDQGSTESCRVYRLRLNILARTATVTKVQDLTGMGMGSVQPAVDASGRQLATVINRGKSANGNYPAAVGLLLDDGGGWPIFLREPVGPSARRPAKPTFWGAKRVLWTSNVGGELDDDSPSWWWANLMQSNLASGSAPSVLLGGPEGENSDSNPPPPCEANPDWPSADCVSWRDAQVHPNPAALSHLVAAEWVTVFGRHGIDPLAAEGRPIVARLPDGSAIQEFDLGNGNEGDSIVGCHHPAWSITGGEIACTREKSFDDTVGLELDVHGLYGFRFPNFGRWQNQGEVIRSTDVRGDPDFPHFHGLAYSGNDHPVLSYKYATWVASDRWIAATVFITQGGSHNVLMSRVVLFDTTGAEAPLDLVEFVEDAEGATRGEWRAVSSEARR